jgi:proton-translocating NADH-quinone oxidoreductase chain N
VTSRDILALMPLAIVGGGAFFIYLFARFITERNDILASVTASVFGLAIIALILLIDQCTWQAGLGAGATSITRAGGMCPSWGNFGTNSAALRAGSGSLVMSALALGMGFFVALYCGRYLSLDQRYKITYPLLLLMVAGLIGMVMSTDLFTLYLFCELMSITAYVLVAFRRHTDTAVEAGFKYLIMGTTGTLALLMGLSLIYRETGSLTLPQTITTPGLAARGGLGLILVGLAVKSAIVPLHTWMPDAYGRAPSSVSAMLAGAVKQATFFVLLKVALGLGYPSRDLGTMLLIFSVLNMTIGNFVALVQTNTKRLLAYSSIAQLGYVMFALGIGLRYDVPSATQGGFFLLLAYAAMKSLAFLSKGVCHFYCGTTQVSELRGTSKRLPWIAGTFSIALIGMAGVAPLAGFAGKWYTLAEILAVRDWIANAGVAIFLLNSVLALGYYLPLLAQLYAPLRDTDDQHRIRISRWMLAPLAALTLIVVWMGLFPGLWLEWAANLLIF